MKKTYTYDERLFANVPPYDSPRAYEMSRDKFDQGAYLESIHYLLDSFNPTARLRYDDELEKKTEKKASFFSRLFFRSDEKKYGPGRSFTIPHGALKLHISISEESVNVHVPFLELPDDSRAIPMLRNACELNLGQLDTVFVTLKGNQLHFDFSCPVELAHPRKLRYMFQELCSIANRYYYEFIEKFGAKPIEPHQIIECDAAEVNRVIGVIRRTCKEIRTEVQIYLDERKIDSAWHVFLAGFLKLNYVIQSQNSLYYLFRKTLRELSDENLDLPHTVNAGLSFLDELDAKSDEEYRKHLHQMPIFCSLKGGIDLGDVRSDVSETLEAAIKDFESNAEEACLKCIFRIYNIYFFNDVPEEWDRILTQALRLSQDKPFDTAAPILFKGMSELTKR